MHTWTDRYVDIQADRQTDTQTETDGEADGYREKGKVREANMNASRRENGVRG